jgi:hypothetical protein
LLGQSVVKLTMNTSWAVLSIRIGAPATCAGGCRFPAGGREDEQRDTMRPRSAGRPPSRRTGKWTHIASSASTTCRSSWRRVPRSGGTGGACSSAALVRCEAGTATLPPSPILPTGLSAIYSHYPPHPPGSDAQKDVAQPPAIPSCTPSSRPLFPAPYFFPSMPSPDPRTPENRKSRVNTPPSSSRGNLPPFVSPQGIREGWVD